MTRIEAAAVAAALLTFWSEDDPDSTDELVRDFTGKDWRAVTDALLRILSVEISAARREDAADYIKALPLHIAVQHAARSET